MPVDPNIPLPAFDNLFLADPLGERFWRHWLGAEAFAALRPHFVTLGEAGARAAPFSAEADRSPPRLLTHDAAGARVDRVAHHPAYAALEALAYGGGIVSLKYDADFLAHHRERRHLVGFGAGYYFAQSEIGLYCPVCLTDGVGRVLERHADPALAAEVIARLGAREPERRWQGAMFLTERQGGSDVGANAAEARREGDRWLLRGDKWFCSNVGAEAILALARLPGAPPGTRGLGLFLVLRARPAGNGATIRIHRLKDKLGVRSMATGEVTFEDTEAFLIGGEGEGFKQMTEMLNLSRLYNAVASVAGLRRALLEALAYGRDRRAFGRPLRELPLWRASLADLAAEHLGIFVLTFEAVRALDRADGGDADAGALVRLLTPMVKALSGKLSVFGVGEAMEAVGGNAYVEESILPRLLRDVQVLPIWEGTTNILTLDTLRAVEREGAHEAFFARAARAVETIRGHAATPHGAVETLEPRLEQDRKQLGDIAALRPDHAQRAVRAWLETAGRTLTELLVLEAATHEPLREVCVAAWHRIADRPFATAPLASGHAAALADTEEPLLRAASA